MEKIVDTDIPCPECDNFIRWSKIEFIRDDGAYDWKLAVWCPKCGFVKDKAINDRVEKDYYRRLLIEIRKGQNSILDNALTPELHAHLEAMLKQGIA